ncbi:hypothetical protein WOLCODRAFT_167432 [Wolfiporia cocos MD-104 SS10]|uniref:Uncharacterized protein n=1 Tax=Wolfiporia cocos (strain MD-104) TaxID=742152 RepID=A0A2H3JBY5_WOLCO|nr:hypothetical protein WOLCODRAFT_167432 [Wolfiporia cocos MD-104 SS10]
MRGRGWMVAAIPDINAALVALWTTYYSWARTPTRFIEYVGPLVCRLNGRSVAALAPLDVVPLNTKQHAALSGWDTLRGPWRVLYALQSALLAIYLPMSSLCARAPHDANGQADREEDVSALFQPRSSDATDPYVAVYAPPTLASVADAVHVRWTGLLHTPFVTDVATALMFIPLPSNPCPLIAARC